MDLDAVLLARIQFAFTVSFHIIFPSFTIGLAAFIATLLVRWRITGEDRFQRLARFWTKIFAVSFAMGVVSGIVLSYQFGTNWAGFSKVTGNVLGPLIGYEVLTAFFLEASFLGIMLFGWNRVSPNLHVLSAVLVAVGTSLSAFWILAANSWMHTPAGHEIRDGIAYPVDWLAIIFNPSFPYRFSHMFTAAYLTTSIVVLAVGARYIVQNRFIEEAKTMVRMGLGMVAVLAPLQLVIGDMHGLNTKEYQPAKLAAIEGALGWQTNLPTSSFSRWPNQEGTGNAVRSEVPHSPALRASSSRTILPARSTASTSSSLKTARPIAPVFFAFRVMVGLGLLMIVMGVVGAFFWFRGTLFQSRTYFKLVQHAWPMGFIAILSGWWVTESGRQPWLATGILRTYDAVSPAITFNAVLTTLILFVVVYTAVFSMGTYYINRLINKGPSGAAEEPPHGQPTRPLSAAEDATREAIIGAR